MYVMALKSVCENPRNYSGINLINKLENQFIRTLGIVCSLVVFLTYVAFVQ